MFNKVLLTGRLVHSPTCYFLNDERKMIVPVAVTRDIPNKEDEYETYFFDCIVNGVLATDELAKCKTGQMIAIKGYLQSSIIEKDDRKEYCISVIAEAITILMEK